MAVSFVAAGTASAAAAGTAAPGNPAGLAAGDLKLLAHGIRGTGTAPATPSGWTQLYDSGIESGRRLIVFYRFHVGGDAAPSYASNASGSDCFIAQVCAFRGTETSTTGTPPAFIGTLGTSSGWLGTLNMGPVTGGNTPAGGAAVVIGFKGDDWTNVATLSGDGLTWAEIGEPDSNAGNDAGLAWDYALSASSTTVTSKTFTVTGGTVSDGLGIFFSIDPPGGATAYELDCQPASFAITGTLASPVAGRMVNAATGTYSITGIEAGLNRGRFLAVDPGAYTLTGTLASTLADRVLPANPGSYALTGVAASVVAGRVLSADPGAYSITGVLADLVHTAAATAYEINAESGAYTLTGSVADALAGRMLSGDSGTYAITGVPASLLADRVLPTTPGLYVITGRSADLPWSGDIVVVEVRPRSINLGRFGIY
jgi:hypothetical protein